MDAHGSRRRVEGVEVAIVVLAVRRPDPSLDRATRVVDGELLPIRDVAHVLGKRPGRPAGVRWRVAWPAPGRVVQTGPGRLHPIPESLFVGPKVAVRAAH